MNCKIGKLTALAAAFALALGLASTASAQVFTGRIDVTIEDATGGRLPGVNVDLTGPVNQTQVTDAQGQAHFLNLNVGTYTVKATLSGFNTYTNNDVVVATGASTPLNVRMAVAGTQETVTVTAATPVIDTKKETTTTNVTLEELQNIPSARDPWVVMQTVPSIYVDRVNVGGSESGQQSNYMGKGSYGGDNTWNVDGVPITDMAATGSTPTYYDFDMFQEMSVTTGGADASNPTPGVQLNMVLKKGSNTPHGDANLYWEGPSLQSSNIPADLVARLGGVSGKGNRTDKYLDRGVDLGGPIVKDHLWAWGRIGQTDVTNLILTGAPDATTLKNYAFKADGQATNDIRLNFTFFEGNKVKNGRGVSATRLPETAWNQTGPTKLYKEEGNFVIGQNLVLAARLAEITGGFTLAPVGGMSTSSYIDDAGIYHGSYVFFTTDRPQTYAGADGSYFAGKQEIKFGFSWRRTPVTSQTVWPGNRTFTIWGGYPTIYGQVTQDFNQAYTARYMQAFVTDTISLDRLTVIAGVRFDHQTSSLDATSTPAVPGFGTLLPAKTIPAQDNVFDFNAFVPRVGFTYALDENHKSILRGSYAMFASQLPAGAATFVSPAQYSYAYYQGVDTNGNHVLDPSEVVDCGAGIPTGACYVSGFDPTNPAKLTTNNQIASSLTVPKTHEFMIGVDHELIPNFGISATFTYRHMNDFLWSPPTGATTADYNLVGHISGTFPNVGTVNEPFYALSEAVAAAGNFGFTTANRPDYHQTYLGFELSATKRMSNHWMGRVGFSTNSWKEYLDAPDAMMDPTRTPTASTFPAFPGFTSYGPNINGGDVVIQSAGSGKSGIYMVAPRYTINANGMYQAPWGIDLGANLAARQGYGEPWYRDRAPAHDPVAGNKTVLLAPTAAATRLPGVTEFDARLEWTPTRLWAMGHTNLAFDLDVFNILNNATTLGIQYNARVTTYNNVLEIQNPRIARLGVRFTF